MRISLRSLTGQSFNPPRLPATFHQPLPFHLPVVDINKQKLVRLFVDAQEAFSLFCPGSQKVEEERPEGNKRKKTKKNPNKQSKGN